MNIIRVLPELDESRVETGPVRFGDDWPGVFIRGDNAFHYAMHLEQILESAEGHLISQHVIEGLVDLLYSCEL